MLKSAVLTAALCLPLFLGACEEHDGPFEQMGEEVDDAADDVEDAAEDTADSLEDTGDRYDDDF